MGENKNKYILKYCSPHVLYIVNEDKRLDKRRCPFAVVANRTVGEIEEGEKVLVERIQVTPDLITVFIINGKAYYYYHFDIL